MSDYNMKLRRPPGFLKKNEITFFYSMNRPPSANCIAPYSAWASSRDVPNFGKTEYRPIGFAEVARFCLVRLRFVTVLGVNSVDIGHISFLNSGVNYIDSRFRRLLTQCTPSNGPIITTVDGIYA
jgi:hypothetical protein